MTRNRGVLVFLAAAMMIAAGGLTTLTTSSQELAKAEVTFLPPSTDGDLPGTVCAAAEQPLDAEGADRVPPDCCTTQCIVDRDCNKICGKGNCTCVQVSPCCRRCVY